MTEEIEQLKAKGKKIIVTKIETKEQYEEALKVGDFFEGSYLESPYILKEFEITPTLRLPFSGSCLWCTVPRVPKR